jgi:hypothetical protein
MFENTTMKDFIGLILCVEYKIKEGNIHNEEDKRNLSIYYVLSISKYRRILYVMFR